MVHGPQKVGMHREDLLHLIYVTVDDKVDVDYAYDVSMCFLTLGCTYGSKEV